MSAINETRPSLDIGWVIQETFTTLGRNLGPFLILAILLAGVPSAIVNSVSGTVTSTSSLAAVSSQVYSSISGALVLWLSGLILQGTLIYGTVSDLNGRQPSIADSLRTGLTVFLPLLAIGILFGLAFAVGLVLLIVPGIMLAVAWCVVVPVYVIERPPLMDSFGRAAALTRGNRWQIFGLFVVVVIATVILEVIFGVIGGITGLFTLGGFPVVTRLIVLPLVSALSALLGATGTAVLYVELRRIRDGIGPEGLAAIFD